MSILIYVFLCVAQELQSQNGKLLKCSRYSEKTTQWTSLCGHVVYHTHYGGQHQWRWVGVRETAPPPV